MVANMSEKLFEKLSPENLEKLSPESLEDAELTELLDSFFSENIMNLKISDPEVLKHLSKIQDRVVVLEAQEESAFVRRTNRIN
jgi:hypothetical protein